MVSRLARVIVLVCCCAGCAPGPFDSKCDWPEEPASTLDLRTSADRRHLNADARIAEEIAIRHADATRGRRSGHYQGSDEYQRSRERCLSTLSAAIAETHHLRIAQIAVAVAQRDERVDAMVLVVFAALFVIAANGVVLRVFRRFPADEPAPRAIGTIAAAIVVSIAGVIVGGLAAAIVEMVRLGNAHLGYRTARLPWNQHWALLFLGAVALFSIIAAVRWRGRDGSPA
jgi:hypothetical protein